MPSPLEDIPFDNFEPCQWEKGIKRPQKDCAMLLALNEDNTNGGFVCVIIAYLNICIIYILCYTIETRQNQLGISYILYTEFIAHGHDAVSGPLFALYTI